MQCPKCGFENPDGMKFCGECAAPLKRVCSSCGTENPPQFKFCGECATPLQDGAAQLPVQQQSAPPQLEDLHSQLQTLIPDALAQKYLSAEQQATGENRPITALFADISGFTPMSQNHSSESMFQLVQECFKQLVNIVAGYEASISGFRGDGLLALFGAPILHENDAERAVLAALDMRAAMQEQGLQVSIGINTGLMTVGEIQTQLHSEYTAYSSDVNLASRLQTAADAGQILVGEGTYRHTRRAFDFEKLTDLVVKGFSEPVTAYSVQQVKVRPEKVRGIEGLRARMIGREHEFTHLREATDEWLSGRGQVVSVIGEAGIGKSRLVSELKEYLSETRGQGDQESGRDADTASHLVTHSPSLPLVLEGRCVSIGQPISYWPFLDILRSYFGLSEEDTPTQVADKVTTAITHLFPDTHDEVLPLLGHLLSVKFGNELDDRLKFASPEQIRHQTLMRLRDLFETLARQQPLLLVLEDLHWADDLSLDLIGLLLDSLATLPLMLLCVYRPEKEHRVWQLASQAQRKCFDRFTELTLKQLTTSQSRHLVEELLTIDNLPESIKSIILTKSEGNPFFIEEVIRSLIGKGLVYRESDRWVAREEISDLDVPDTIQSVVLARVDTLESEAKYVLQCASIIGRLFRYRLLEHLTRQEHQLDSYLDEFEHQDLVLPERTIPELEYAFKHAFTQEATYQSVLEQRRKQFHEMVGAEIERLYGERIEEYYEELAYHYSHSDNHEKAVEYLLKAGQKAALRYASQDALTLYHQAMNYAVTDNQRISVLKLRAKLLLSTYHGEDAADDYQSLLDMSLAKGDRTLQLKAILGLASACYIMAFDNATLAERYAELNQQAHTLASEIGDMNGVARALLSTVHLWGDFALRSREEALTSVRQAWSLADQVDDEELISDIKVHRYRFGLDTGPESELITELREQRHLSHLKEVYFYMMMRTTSRGDFQACIECCDAAVTLAGQLGVPPVMYPSFKAFAAMKMGYYDMAWEAIQQEIADQEHLLGCAIRDTMTGIYLLELGTYDRAVERLSAALNQAQELRRPWLCAVARSQLIRAQLNLGCVADTSNLENSHSWSIPWTELLAEVALRQGNLDKSLSLADAAIGEASEEGHVFCEASGSLLKAAALLARNGEHEALRILEHTMCIAQQYKYLPLTYQVHILEARAYHILGDTTESERATTLALELREKLTDSIPQKELRQSFASRRLTVFGLTTHID